MKINSATITNFKRLRYLELKPQGALIVIGGANGQGKTSLIDALADGLAGKKTDIPQPVTRGQTESRIEITLDDGFVITKYYKIDDKGELSYGLKLTKGDLEAAKAVGTLAKFHNALSFDPLSFARERPHEQAETLRKLLGLDFAALDKRRQEIFERRTVTNRMLRDAIGAIELLPEPRADAPHLVDLSALLQRQAEWIRMQQANQQVRQDSERRNNARALTRDRVNDLATRITQLEKQLGDARGELAMAERADDEAIIATRDAQKAVLALVDPDLEGLNEEIATVEENNRAARLAGERDAKHAHKMELEKEANGYTFELEEVDREKEAAIAGVTFPVPGLGFDGADGTVTLNGLPLSQAAESEKVWIGAAVALAMSPHLRVLLIRDGSGVGPEALELLRDLAMDNGAQIFIERVGTEGASIVIEDGYEADR